MYEVLRRQHYNIAVLNSAKMQQSQSLFSHFHGEVGLPHSNFDYIKACTDFLTAIPSECTIYRPRFHFVLQFQIVSNTVTTHHLRSLFSFILCSSKSFQIPSECMRQRPCFQNVLCSSKYRQNACFRGTLFVFSQLFQIV